MKSLRLLFGLAIIAIASTTQAGQSFPTHAHKARHGFQQPQQMSAEERAKQETAWMKTDLALNDQQLVKVDSINLKFAKKRSEMRSQMQGMDRESIMAKMQEMQSQKEAELKAVLTEEQLKKYKELVIQRRGNRGPGMGRGNS
jgi:periplasmic protein CpxP/Spy